MENRIRRIYTALSSLGNAELKSIRPQFSNLPDGILMAVDFNQNSGPAELENAAQSVIANIASLRDHLKIWCSGRGANFNGDKLIDSNMSVALIHDLWNVEKHATLNRPPRSKTVPKLIDLHRAMVTSLSGEENSVVSFSMDWEGNQTVSSDNGGTVKLEIMGQIVDDRGKSLGDFRKTCDDAIEAWSAELIAAGVPLAMFP